MDTPTPFNPEMSSELTKNITMKELHSSYQGTKGKAAPGPTGIRNTQWKNAPQRTQVIILDMMNNIYKTGQIPQEMKNGTIYPIPKDPTLPCTSANARPLTMLETGLKILTQCLANRIQTILKKNPIYSSMQYAFLPGRTIQDPIHLVEIAQANARKNNKEIHLTFLDLTQAFDRLEFWASDLALQRLNYPKQFTDLIDNLNTESNRKNSNKRWMHHKLETAMRSSTGRGSQSNTLHNLNGHTSHLDNKIL